MSGFTDTAEETEKAEAEDDDIEYDMEIKDEEIVYEYEELEDDSPIIPDEDELEKTRYFEKLLEEVIAFTEKGGEI